MSETPRPYAHKGDLTNGPVKGHLMRMTIPMIWGLFAVIAVQLADTYFIALMDDTHILAGFSFTFPVTMVISHIVFGLNIALSSVCARLIGAGQIQDMRRVVLHGLILAFCVSGIIAIGTYLFLQPLFYMLGAGPLTYPTIVAYMPIWLVASVVLSMPVNANSAMRASGDTATPAISMIIVAVVNFILDPLLIFGWFGFPALGVQGAAIATLIGYCTGGAVALYFLVAKKQLVAIDSLHLDKFKDSLSRLAVIAIPAGIANIIGPSAAAVVVAVLANYGADAVAAYGIVSRIEALAMLVVIAIASGMAPIIGQNWGAQKFKRVHETINLAIVVNLIWSAVVAIVLAVFANPIAVAFSQDPEVIRLCVLFFWIVPFSYGIGNLVFGWASAFNAMGKPQRAFIMVLVKSYALTVPGALIGGWLYGALGVFISLAVTNLIAGSLFHILSNRLCLNEEAQCLQETQPAQTQNA